MENNNNEKKSIRWQIIVGVSLLFVILVGLNIYTYIQLTDLNEKMDGVVAEKNLIETQLYETQTQLETVTNDLTVALEENERLLDVITKQSDEIKEYEAYIEDDEAKWKQRYEEYSTATEVWVCMKAQGWSDTVCAGIMGNLMAETGGTGSLYLDWDSNGSNGYGLVQWIGGRRNTIKNKYGTYPTIQEQVQFIHDELYGTNGVRRQVTDSQFDAIMNAETPEECAYAFACYYERCADFARSMRRGFARKAYEYYVG